MSNASANAQLALVPTQETSSAPSPRAQGEGERSLVLSTLERQPLALLHDDEGEALSFATTSASALAGSDRVAARIDLLARLLAIEHTRQLALARFLDERILARDIEAVAMVDRVLTSSAKRIAILAREHAASCQVGRRDVVVAVAHANTVHVAPTEK